MQWAAAAAAASCLAAAEEWIHRRAIRRKMANLYALSQHPVGGSPTKTGEFVRLTLQDLGYEYRTYANSNPSPDSASDFPRVLFSTRLVAVDDGSPFTFQGEEHYEVLASFVREYVLNLLLRQGMKELKPERACLLLSDRQRSVGAMIPKVLVTDDLETAEVMVVIVHKSGSARTGQWSRRACINGSLEEGSVAPYMERIRERKWAAILLDPASCENDPMPDDVASSEHVLCAWDHVIQKEGAKQIFFIGHGLGGKSVLTLLQHRQESMIERCAGIALIDGAHTGTWYPFNVQEQLKAFLAGRCRNWVRSDKPLGAILSKDDDIFGRGVRPLTEDDPICLTSSGTSEQNRVAIMAMEGVFKFFDNLHDRRVYV
ncbi:hypothetical protein GUITHDRAFT_136685 [Guillardia theta CCMP2712]|uniref:Arb2 domain-containing protein n=3 Tax=Guillardia theta TaxID=55529 RepID=L1JJ76_GUITC|nr:hypothetical protein GUITHDRAFT_136685 [Guillardia theta CCMP2712]EKX48578.1 hypothetical protein GUITHDRAFT_136685 [Guillardia theta CCMP2712]|eukprot:XP_005835558.1 hypothetical protein GUITHDRAFT_136685 [Guillardia theta CCMP2712]